MTSYMLHHLPRALRGEAGTTGEETVHTRRQPRILDFACGSGTISKYILSKNPRALVTMLDADVLAIAAAKRNVPDAAAHVLSDCWTWLDTVQKGVGKHTDGTNQAHGTGSATSTFDWIVSNPPVHVGRSQHFGVLTTLLAHAANYLAKPHGKLVFVAQNYIPARLLAPKNSQLDLSLLSSDGRFTVWLGEHSSAGASAKAHGGVLPATKEGHGAISKNVSQKTERRRKRTGDATLHDDSTGAARTIKRHKKKHDTQ